MSTGQNNKSNAVTGIHYRSNRFLVLGRRPHSSKKSTVYTTLVRVMSTENRSAVSEEDSGVATASDRVVLMLDMSSETFAESVNDCTGRPTENPDIGGRAASGWPILDKAVGSVAGTVPMASGNTSVCVHCLGSGTSVPLRSMPDNTVADVVRVQDTEPDMDVLAPTVTVMSSRRPRKVRHRSRLNRGRSGGKKKAPKGVWAGDSGDTVMVTAPTPTSASPPEVKVQREVPIDLNSSTDSGDDESSDNNATTYGSGDRCRWSGRYVRFDKRTTNSASVATDVGRQTRRVLRSRDRLSTRSHASLIRQQRLRKHGHRVAPSYHQQFD